MLMRKKFYLFRQNGCVKMAMTSPGEESNLTQLFQHPGVDVLFIREVEVSIVSGYYVLDIPPNLLGIFSRLT